MKMIRWSSLTPQDRQDLLQRPVSRQGDIGESVAAIIRQVRHGGDRALRELTRKLDRAEPLQLELGPTEMQKARESIDPKVDQAIQDAMSRIEVFHAADVPTNVKVKTAPGLNCEVRYLALSPVGLYIPGGSAPLLSTVLMLAIPARIAGCREVIMCSPPARNGEIPPEILAAAQLCGVDRVFCAGGAQAVAALAYGTETIPRCAKIFGPGNVWVTEAKQQVSQDPEGAAIDMPAGPSEVLVIADRDANPEFIAWDLLSQAEHGPDSQVLLVTDSASLASALIEKLQTLAPTTTRAAILEQSLSEARVILVDNISEALRISNAYAPEHLIINTADAAALAEQVENAGSVFIGPWTPESLGDYCSGPNHVLPTYGWARSFGALGVSDYMRRMTLQQASRSALAKVGPTAQILAAVEGLEAHRMAVSVRLQ
ncbi:MAG: histidinol dehydrogenase [Proteobacteria bacterium]|nr:histidinol dehydrogenase [Pseudomonadota bacterium]